MMTVKEVKDFADWLKQNTPADLKYSFVNDDDQFWLLFAFRIVDHLENYEKILADNKK